MVAVVVAVVDGAGVGAGAGLGEAVADGVVGEVVGVVGGAGDGFCGEAVDGVVGVLADCAVGFLDAGAFAGWVEGALLPPRVATGGGCGCSLRSAPAGTPNACSLRYAPLRAHGLPSTGLSRVGVFCVRSLLKCPRIDCYGVPFRIAKLAPKT